jgi:hypothetical protein
MIAKKRRLLSRRREGGRAAAQREPGSPGKGQVVLADPRMGEQVEAELGIGGVAGEAELPARRLAVCSAAAEQLPEELNVHILSFPP